MPIIQLPSGVQLYGLENRVDNPGNPQPTSVWIRFSDYNTLFGTTGRYTLWARVGAGSVQYLYQGTVPPNCVTPTPSPTNPTQLPTSTAVYPAADPLCTNLQPNHTCNNITLQSSPQDILAFVLMCESDFQQTQTSVLDVAWVIANRLNSGHFNAGNDFSTIAQLIVPFGSLPNPANSTVIHREHPSEDHLQHRHWLLQSNWLLLEFPVLHQQT